MVPFISDPCVNYNCRKVLPYSLCKAVDDQPECKCPECDATVEPVCASNSQTYTSECIMRRVSCKQRQTFAVKSKGKCGRFEH